MVWKGWDYLTRDFKGQVNKKLLAYYEEHGVDDTIRLCHEMLQSKLHKDELAFRTQVHGEICETVLEIKVLDFMRKHKLEDKWFYEKGLILKDINRPNSQFSTEIDFTLFTPFKLLTIECKCYAGDKQIIKECTIKRKGQKPMDVYKQHSMHFKVLMSNLHTFHREQEINGKRVAPIQACYFSFAEGTIEDLREEKYSRSMPILTVNNIDRLLEWFMNDTRTWDMKALRKAIDVINKHKEKNTKDHLDYVIGLQKRRK